MLLLLLLVAVVMEALDVAVEAAQLLEDAGAAVAAVDRDALLLAVHPEHVPVEVACAGTMLMLSDGNEFR